MSYQMLYERTDEENAAYFESLVDIELHEVFYRDGNKYYLVTYKDKYKGLINHLDITHYLSLKKALEDLTDGEYVYRKGDHYNIEHYIYYKQCEVPFTELPDRSGLNGDEYYLGNIIVTKDGYRKIDFYMDNIVPSISEDREYWGKAVSLLNAYPEYAVPVVMSLMSPLVGEAPGREKIGWTIAPATLFLTGIPTEDAELIKDLIEKAYGVYGVFTDRANDIDKLVYIKPRYKGGKGRYERWHRQPFPIISVNPKNPSKTLYVMERATRNGGDYRYISVCALSKESDFKKYSVLNIPFQGKLLPESIKKSLRGIKAEGIIVDVVRAFLEYGIDNIKQEVLDILERKRKEENYSEQTSYCYIYTSALIKVAGRVLRENGLLDLDTDKLALYVSEYYNEPDHGNVEAYKI